MNNKYFIPEIEDLYIGYESTIFHTGEFNSFYKKIILDKKDLLNFLNFNDDLRNGNGYPLDFLRTPFLTKEQVEQEGWVNKENYLIKEDIYKEEDGDFAGIHYRLYLHKNETLTIERLSINEYDGKPYYDLYEGNQNHIVKNIKIKSINEFRKLLKMLEI